MGQRTLIVNEDAMKALVRTMTDQRALIDRLRTSRQLRSCRRDRNRT